MRISHGLTPPGGWSYKDGDITIYGQTWGELLTNVIAHKTSNGKPLGNVSEEIEDQISNNFPKLIIN